MNRRTARRLVALLCGLMFAYGLLLGGLQLVVDDIASGFGIGTAGIGLLVSVQHISSTVMPALMGALADKIGKKKVLCAFCLVFSLGCLLAGVAKAMPIYMIGTMLYGAGVCESQCCAVLSDLDRENSARLINLSQGLLCVGAILGPLMIEFTGKYFGANGRIVFFVCAAAHLVLAVLLLGLRFPPAAPAAVGSEKTPMRAFFTSGTFIALFIAMLLYVGLENGFGYFTDSLFLERVQTSGAPGISLYWAGMAVSRLVFSLRPYKIRRVMLACFAAAAVLLAALAFTRAHWLMLVLCALVGAAYGPTWSTLVAAAAAEFPDRAASATGLMSTACGLGGIFYPILMGAVAGRASLTAAFLLLAGTALACCICTLKLRK